MVAALEYGVLTPSRMQNVCTGCGLTPRFFFAVRAAAGAGVSATRQDAHGSGAYSVHAGQARGERGRGWRLSALATRRGGLCRAHHAARQAFAYSPSL